MLGLMGLVWQAALTSTVAMGWIFCRFKAPSELEGSGRVGIEGGGRVGIMIIGCCCFQLVVIMYNLDVSARCMCK